MIRERFHHERTFLYYRPLPKFPRLSVIAQVLGMISTTRQIEKIFKIFFNHSGAQNHDFRKKKCVIIILGGYVTVYFNISTSDFIPVSSTPPPLTENAPSAVIDSLVADTRSSPYKKTSSNFYGTKPR